MPGLAERLERVRSDISGAVRDAGRSESEITTIVVTKFHPASLVRELAALGVTDVGENRHQEASAKAEELADLDVAWHFVGQLQSNKARAVADYAQVIHSVDRASVVDALGAASLDAFIQVNLTDDPGRGGVRVDAIDELATRVLESPSIRLLGLMAVAPLGVEPRRAFETVRRASERLQTIAPDARYLSMGMSGDFAAAIAEGATHLRIGTAITGNRPERG